MRNFWKTTLILLSLAGLCSSSWALTIEAPSGTRRIVFLDAQDKPLKALEDHDGDGLFESTFFYRNGLPFKMITDKNQDGKPEEVFLFDEKGRPKELRLDRNGDGRPDKWQFYRQGKVFRIEEDQNFDGKKDLIAELDAKENLRLLRRDEDGDGCFEVEEKHQGKEKIVTIYKLSRERDCSSARVFSRIYFQGETPWKRLFDRDLDGSFELSEILRPDGTRCLLVKGGKEAFFYQKGPEPTYGYRDVDKDGRFEEIFDYQRGTWKKISPLSLEELEKRCREGGN